MKEDRVEREGNEELWVGVPLILENFPQAQGPSLVQVCVCDVCGVCRYMHVCICVCMWCVYVCTFVHM